MSLRSVVGMITSHSPSSWYPWPLEVSSLRKFPGWVSSLTGPPRLREAYCQGLPARAARVGLAGGPESRHRVSMGRGRLETAP